MKLAVFMYPKIVFYDLLVFMLMGQSHEICNGLLLAGSFLIKKSFLHRKIVAFN
jgi:hypothetical protein